MSRIWSAPPAPPPTPSPLAGPVVTVPQPDYTRLRETLIEVYGLDAGCTDNAIVLAAREHLDRIDDSA